jgi:hypothetical protein
MQATPIFSAAGPKLAIVTNLSQLVAAPEHQWQTASFNTARQICSFG